MPKSTESTDQALITIDEMRVDFMQQAGELWEKHQDKFMTIMRESEDKSVNVAFSAALSFSESSPGIETKIGYSQNFRDKMNKTYRVEDPNQTHLPLEVGEQTEEAEQEKPKRNGKGRGRRNTLETVEVEAEAV